ncbi:MAG: hypothetical protein AB199_03535 [Parcubacteria bacterium C7867-004]|nr:MAG: hypothetical protein AB199_03535 [Parcubacteria bacterium C7867-004]
MTKFLKIAKNGLVAGALALSMTAVPAAADPFTLDPLPGDTTCWVLQPDGTVAHEQCPPEEFPFGPF